MTRATVLIADDHDLARSGIAAIITGADSLDLVAQAHDGLEAVELCRLYTPDIALLDIRMPKLDGLEAAAQIRLVSPSTKIMMLTMHESLDYLEAAIHAGASGYVLKEVSRDALLRMIATVLEGQEFFDADLVKRLLNRVSRLGSVPLSAIAELTNREREILCRLTTGETNKQIAKMLGISPGTVKVHVERVISKLGVADRTQAAVLAVQAGLVSTGAET